MLINLLIKQPLDKVNSLDKQIKLHEQLKSQHIAAIKYRFKRFAATKVGIASAFFAGIVVASTKSNSKLVKKYGWLVKLLN